MPSVTIVGYLPASKVVTHHMAHKVARQVVCDPAVYVLGGYTQRCH